MMTVESILEAAARLLAAQGFEATTTTKVAELAGVSVGSLYEYFPSKEALTAKLLKRHCDRMLTTFEIGFERARGAGLEQVINEFIRATFDAYASDVALHRVLLEEMGRVSKPHHLRRVSLAIADLLEKALVDCPDPITRPSIRIAAFVVESSVEALAHRAITFIPELFGQELRIELCAMVIAYLRAPQP